jgi:hypothetical protein
VSDADLRSLVRNALATRDRSSTPPSFATSWRAAVTAGDARRRPAASWFVWLGPAAAVAGIVAIALAVAWQYMGPRTGPTPWTEAADLQLARELAPARQWPVATDSLLHTYEYGSPSAIVIPEIENPFEESFL